MIERIGRYISGPGLGPVLVRAVLGSAGVRILGMGFGLLVGVQLARGLGAEGYGIYGVAMSLTALLNVPTEFGLPQLLTREVAVAHVAKDWVAIRGVLRWATRAVLLTCASVAALAGVALLASHGAIESSLSEAILVGMALIPLVALGNLRSATIRGLQKIVRGQLPDGLIRPAAFSALLFIAALCGLPMTPAVAMALGAGSAAIALMLATLMLSVLLADSNGDSTSVRGSHSRWISAVPLALTEGMRVLQGHLVILVLGALATAAVVGEYRVASSVSMLISVPVTLLNVVSAPVIARLHAQDDEARLQRLIRWIALAMTLSTAVLTLPFVFAGEPLVVRVFGAEYADAATPLVLLSAGTIASACFGPSAALLNMTGNEKWVTRASGVSLGLLAVTSAPLIIGYGDVGAALATGLASVTWSLLMWWKARQLLALDSCVFLFASTQRPRNG